MEPRPDHLVRPALATNAATLNLKHLRPIGRGGGAYPELMLAQGSRGAACMDLVQDGLLV